MIASASGERSRTAAWNSPHALGRPPGLSVVPGSIRPRGSRGASAALFTGWATSVVISAMATARQAMRPHHLGRLELRLELSAASAGEPHDGLGGRVLLPAALDRGGSAR